uniref:Uncharacterized protein n=1 Tax=Knipowitschia caucasica TaxID=637954 RepID=A0AAV2J9E1_KNICA
MSRPYSLLFTSVHTREDILCKPERSRPKPTAPILGRFSGEMSLLSSCLKVYGKGIVKEKAGEIEFTVGRNVGTAIRAC